MMTFKSDLITMIHVSNKYIIHVMSLNIKLILVWSICWSKTRLILADDQKFSIAHVHENKQAGGSIQKFLKKIIESVV